MGKWGKWGTRVQQEIGGELHTKYEQITELIDCGTAHLLSFGQRFAAIVWWTIQKTNKMLLKLSILVIFLIGLLDALVR